MNMNGAFPVMYPTLRTGNLDRQLSFYRDVLGLVPHEFDGAVQMRPVDGSSTIVELVEQPGARPHAAPTAGLFHVAILVPQRVELALVLRHLLQVGWPLQGGSDHGVSEALYLADAEGNGIEIYADRPRAEWPREQGVLKMVTLPLDAHGLLTELSDSDAFERLSRDTVVGHVHLRVSSVEEADELLVSVLGMDATGRNYPGALFASYGGYHHHFAANTWHGRGAPPLPLDATGLVSVRLSLRGNARLDDIHARATGSGVAAKLADGVLELSHAGGIRILASDE